METISKKSEGKFQLGFPEYFTRPNIELLIAKIETGLAVGEKRTLINVVTELGEKGKFESLLSCIANDEVLMDGVLANSYFHHNGFHKIVLIGTSYFKLRLHLFKPIAEVPFPMENIHNHRWNFASKILKGKLMMELFTQDERGSVEMNDYNYLTKNMSDHYVVEYQGKIRLSRSSAITYDAGCTYFMRSEELHRIINPENLETFTLMMTGLSLSDKCKLYSHFTFEEKKQNISKYSKNELLSLFESAING